MKKRRASADQRGFTLAELLVAIAILALIMTGLLTLLKRGNESYLAGANQLEAQATFRAALERMTTDLREAGYDPTSAGFLAMTNESGTAFTIQNDWDGNGLIEPAIPVPLLYTVGGVATNVNRGEQITYAAAGGNLTRQESQVDGAAQILVTSVQQAGVGVNCAGAQILNPPIFQYCDTGSNPAAGANIRTILVNLTVGAQNQTPGSWQAGAVQVTMSDRIRLRNR